MDPGDGFMIVCMCVYAFLVHGGRDFFASNSDPSSD